MSFSLLLCNLSFQGLLGQVLSATEVLCDSWKSWLYHQSWFRGIPFRSLLQGGLKGLEAKGGGDEGLKVEGSFTFRRLQGTSRGLEEGFTEASRGLKGGFTFGRLQGGLKVALRGL